MKRARALAATAALTAVTAWYLGCAAVPDIRFVDDSADSGADTGADGANADGNGSGDGSVFRDGTAACTSPSPGGGATCCGDVWCIGDCSSINCDQCASRGCQGGEVCCGKTGNVMCKTRCP